MMQHTDGGLELTHSPRAARNVQPLGGVQQVVRPPRRRRGPFEPGLGRAEARPWRQVAKSLCSRADCGGEKGGLG